MSLPKRTADTMSDAIALSSPSGRMSKRARKAAERRLAEALFGADGLQQPQTPQPSEAERLRRHAARLRTLAAAGMSPRKFRREADKAEAEAAALEAKP